MEIGGGGERDRLIISDRVAEYLFFPATNYFMHACGH